MLPQYALIYFNYISRKYTNFHETKCRYKFINKCMNSYFYIFINLFHKKRKRHIYIVWLLRQSRFEKFSRFHSNLEGKCGPFGARKYLKSAITKFLFRSDDHQWSEAVFGASFLRPASDHCEKGVQEYSTRSTSRWDGVRRVERQRSKGWIEV